MAQLQALRVVCAALSTGSSSRRDCVVRAPAALTASEERFDVFAHVAANLSAPLDDAETLARRMTSFLRLRSARVRDHAFTLLRRRSRPPRGSSNPPGSATGPGGEADSR